ncbi:MAG: hypothetical protein ACRDL7_13955, partial [Gaiellaceae bacterium]
MQVELQLCEPHLSATIQDMEALSLSTRNLLGSKAKMGSGRLILRRSIALAGEARKPRLRSHCVVDRQPVTLKTLTSLASPLLALVDAPAAASALSRPSARLAILDAGVPPNVLAESALRKANYKTCQQERKQVEHQIATLPSALSGADDESSAMLSHWIEELDGFERRVEEFCRLAGQSEDPSITSIAEARRALSTSHWSENLDVSNEVFSSALLVKLNKLRDVLKLAAVLLRSIRTSIDTLSSLSSSGSAMSALDLTRSLLLDCTKTGLADCNLAESIETAHNLLNAAQSLIEECARFVEDDQQGPLSLAESALAACPVT